MNFTKSNMRLSFLVLILVAGITASTLDKAVAADLCVYNQSSNEVTVIVDISKGVALSVHPLEAEVKVAANKTYCANVPKYWTCFFQKATVLPFGSRTRKDWEMGTDTLAKRYYHLAVYVTDDKVTFKPR
jgi:hypothetical protein